MNKKTSFIFLWNKNLIMTLRFFELISQQFTASGENSMFFQWWKSNSFCSEPAARTQGCEHFTWSRRVAQWKLHYPWECNIQEEVGVEWEQQRKSNFCLQRAHVGAATRRTINNIESMLLQSEGIPDMRRRIKRFSRTFQCDLLSTPEHNKDSRSVVVWEKA